MATADGKQVASEIDNPRRPRWRRVVGRVLIVLFSVLAVLSLVLNWAAYELLNTDRFVETMSELSADPAIQEAIANNITNQLVGLFNADAVTNESTNESDPFLRGLARSAATDFIDRTVLRVIQSPEFQQRWDEAIQIAHPHIVALLEGEEYENVQIVDGQVVIDLGPLIVRVEDRLREAGLDFVDRISPDAIDTTFVIFESSALANAQQLIDFMLTWRILFPVIALVSLIGYFVFSADRKSATIWTGMSLAIAMTTLLIAIAIGRRYLLDHLPPSRDVEAISVVFDVLMDGLNRGARIPRARWRGGFRSCPPSLGGYAVSRDDRVIRQPIPDGPAGRYRCRDLPPDPAGRFALGFDHGAGRVLRVAGSRHHLVVCAEYFGRRRHCSQSWHSVIP